MKILKIIKKKKSMYEVVLDNKESLILLENVMIHHEVFLKKMLTEKEIEEIQKENDMEVSYQKCCGYLEKKMRTEKEMRNYLKKDEVSKEIVERVIQALKENHFLDDEKYVNYYVNDNVKFTNDGPLKMERALIDLGIEKETIEKRLDEVPREVWEEKIKKIIQKRIQSNKKDSEMVFKRKLSQYLYTVGYPHEMSSSLVEDIHLENSVELMKKEEEKLRKKLSRKYAGEDLEFQVKRKLYQKGFKRNLDE